MAGRGFSSLTADYWRSSGSRSQNRTDGHCRRHRLELGGTWHTQRTRCRRHSDGDGSGTTGNGACCVLDPQRSRRGIGRVSSARHTVGNGKKGVTAAGLDMDVPDRAHMVTALYHLASSFECVTLRWVGARIEVNGDRLRATVCRLFLREEQSRLGGHCLEWLPYANLTDLWMYNGKTGRPTTPRDFGLLRDMGSWLRDILHWRCLGTGRLLFTLLGKKQRRTTAVKAKVEVLILTLITNFPRLLYWGGLSSEVRVYAARQELPMTFELDDTTPPTLRATGGRDQGLEVTTVQSHVQFTSEVNVALGSKYNATAVHPHPRVSRLVALWTGNRRWTQSRNYYRLAISGPARRRGLASLARRQSCWMVMSANASRGSHD